MRIFKIRYIIGPNVHENIRKISATIYRYAYSISKYMQN